MDAPPEIADLDLPVQPEEEVLRLDIPVDDGAGVQVCEAVGDLADVLGSALSLWLQSMALSLSMSS